MRHETPDDVARELAKYAPRQMKTLLDPAVGSGALLAPLMKKIRSNDVSVHCVDIDPCALDELRVRPGTNTVNITYVNADFLAWSEMRPRLPALDCIIMNPPFSGRKDEFVEIDIGREFPGCAERIRRIPVEAGFLIRAIRLLKPGGRLLAVLPCSIVMSEGLQWLRDALVRIGSIRVVHELPPRTFRNVESRMYLFVFEKGTRTEKIILFNHDLADPERMELRLQQGKSIGRLDFGYQRGMFNLSKLLEYRDLGWMQLSEVVSVFRGSADSPVGPKSSIHTTDYHDGYWWPADRHIQLASSNPIRTIRKGDILAKRVSRDCRLTFGRHVGLQGLECSDCVLIVRPDRVEDSARILFAIKCLCALEWTKALLERGTGASYISEKCLLDLRVPVDLFRRFPAAFRDFSAAIESQMPIPTRTINYVTGRLENRKCPKGMRRPSAG